MAAEGIASRCLRRAWDGETKGHADVHHRGGQTDLPPMTHRGTTRVGRKSAGTGKKAVQTVLFRILRVLVLGAQPHHHLPLSA